MTAPEARGDLLTIAEVAELKLEYMALAAHEADGIRTLEEVELTAFTLKPTREGRQQVHKEDRLSLRELKRESQELQLEVALGFDRNRERLGRDTAAVEPDAGPPTETELRAKAAEYGVHIPAGRFDQIKTKARDDMVALLARADRGRTRTSVEDFTECGPPHKRRREPAECDLTGRTG